MALAFAEPGATAGDLLAVLPVLFAMLWRGGLAADLDSRVLASASMVRATGRWAG
jgi:hypothetical protein